MGEGSGSKYIRPSSRAKVSHFFLPSCSAGQCAQCTREDTLERMSGPLVVSLDDLTEERLPT